MSEICDGEPLIVNHDKILQDVLNEYYESTQNSSNVRHFEFKRLRFDDTEKLVNKLNEISKESYVEVVNVFPTPDSYYNFCCICKVWDSFDGPYESYPRQKKKKKKKKVK